jgi:uncharacterized membrane-anchored protein
MKATLYLCIGIFVLVFGVTAFITSQRAPLWIRYGLVCILVKAHDKD